MLIFGQECFTNGTEWITKITTPGNPQTELIKIEKLDGMVNIDGYDALKMYCEYESIPDSKTLLYYLRTEGDKVFFRLPDDDSGTWYLMYDFGLVAGEGCYLYCPLYTDEENNNTPLKDYFKCISWTKDETSGIYIMDAEEYEDNTCTGLILDGPRWFDGISSTRGISSNIGLGMISGSFPQLLEVKNGERVFYSDNTTSISKVSNAPLRYRVDGLNINLSGTEVSDKIQVYYTNGALLGNFTANGNSINISVPNSGVYVLKLKNTTISIHVPAV